MIRNFTHLDTKSKYWDKKNVEFGNEKKKQDACKKKDNKVIIYIVLLTAERNKIMHCGKKISLYEFNLIWEEIVTILDHLDYRSAKKVIQELYNYLLDKQGKYTAVSLQSQLDALYSMIENVQVQVSEGNLQKATFSKQLKECMDTSKLRAEEIKSELEKLERSVSSLGKDFIEFTQSINRNYSKLLKVSSFAESTGEAMKELLKERQVPTDAINMLQEQNNELKELISWSTTSHNKKISTLSDRVTCLSNFFVLLYFCIVFALILCCLFLYLHCCKQIV